MGLAFVKLTVRDLDAQASFYRTVLGLESTPAQPGQVFLNGAPGRPTLVLVAGDPAAPAPLGEAVLGFRVPDLDGVVDRARAAGGAVRVAPKPIPGGMRVAVVADPEGHAIELIHQA